VDEILAAGVFTPEELRASDRGNAPKLLPKYA
jgi:hypothetical protein